MVTIFQKITDGSLPAQEGWYTTNFGNSYFNGTTFLMPGHDRPTPTTVEFWMQEVTYLPRRWRIPKTVI